MNSQRFNWGIFSVLSIAHLLNDMYANFLPQFIPFLTIQQGLSLGAGTTLVAAFTIFSSLMQPVFGYLVDIKGQRWLLFVGTFWMSLLLGITGFISDYYLLFIVSALAGLGTAAFHPQAAALIGQSTENRKGLALAAFIAIGNFGMAASPLLLMPLFENFGLQSTWVVILPGFITALLLYRYAPNQKTDQKKAAGLNTVFATLKRSISELSKLMVVVALRSLVHMGLVTLLPFYFLAKNYSAEQTGVLMFGTLAVGAIGGIAGGHISDRYGSKPLIIGSLALSSLMFYGFLYTTGILSFVLLAIGGMALLSSFSVTVVLTQEVIPDNKALASGLSLGFAIGIGGLGVSLLGKYADLVGIEEAIKLVFVLPLFAALIGLFLKKKEQVKAL